MSDFKHTPGPWAYRHISKGRQDIDARFRIETLDGVMIADTYYCQMGSEEKLAEFDAKLIAAAPELLEALEALIENKHDSTAYNRAIDAIAKARGES